MKSKIIVACIVVIILFAFKKINDVLSDVGTTIAEVKEQTVRMVYTGYFSPYSNDQIKIACKKLPVLVREATMMSLGKIIKDYVESPQFKTDYYAYVDQAYPNPAINLNDERWIELRKQKTENYVQSMSNPEYVNINEEQGMLDYAAKYPDWIPDGKTKGDFEQDLKDAKLLKELFEKDKEAFKKKYVEIKVRNEMKLEIDEERPKIAAKEKERDELKNYTPIIKKELQQFLNRSSNIDFNATLTKKNGVMMFVNPAYEAKPNDWKFYYRCGKEAVTGARKFAENWLINLK
ncbi:MAG TPA: hypothetical protein VGP43_04395 [Chitinophagaceae bacterium]|nr:hypothetical protein [Chitinophagaceae bacterium]